MDFLKPVLESGRIDFSGQQLATKLSNALLVSSGVAAFIVGFVMQRLSYSFAAYAFGVLVTYFVTLFPWPYFKRNPVVWLSRSSTTQVSHAQSNEKTLGSGKAQPHKTVVEDVSDDES